MACIMDSWVPTASITECAPKPPVSSLIRSIPSVPAFGHDVRGTELDRELLSGSVTAHRDDPLGAQLLRSEHPEQPDRAVTDDGNRLARPRLGGDGGEPAGAQHVGR